MRFLLGRISIAGLLAATTLPLFSASLDIAVTRAYLKSSSSGGSLVTTPVTGQILYFAVDWQITGTGSGVAFAYRALLDGNVYCTGSASQISAPISSSFVCGSGWSATAGNHTLEWDLDYNNAVSETTKSNNSITTSFTVVTPTLDIVAQHAYLKTAAGVVVSTPAPGQTVLLALDWQITGTGGPVAVTYQAFLDGSVYCSGSTGPVAVPNSGTLTCSPGWTATLGGHTLQWVLDYASSVAEISESNNGVSIAFTVFPPGSTPTLDIVAQSAYVVNSSFTPVPNPTPGQFVLLAVNCQFTGTGSFGGLPVKFLLDGQPYSTYTYEYVYKAPTLWYSYGTYWAATPGTHTLEVDVNYDHSVPEIDAANDTVVTTFTVSSPGGATNVANYTLAKATQSSTFAGPAGSSNNPYSAAAAIDGSTDGNFSDNSVATTNQEANPWWQVNLGLSRAIGAIRIWNRTDCCASRLSDYWVFVSDTPFQANDTPATLQNRAGTWSSHQITAPNPSTTIPVNATGGYVRVQLSGTDFLSLAEVQIFDSVVTTLSHTGNFTQGQPIAAYTISVQNSGASDIPAGAFWVYDFPPTGITPTAMTGPGWTCNVSGISSLPYCTRSDALPAGGSYPPVTLTVSVDAATPAPSINYNEVSVSGGIGLAYSVAADSTVIQPPFADVDPTDAFLPAIDLLRESTITSGCQATPPGYCPNDNITLGQMAVFIVRSVMGSDNFTYTSTPYFNDVPANYQFFKWIQKLQDLGIAVPCGTNQYCPDTPITRGIMAVLIIRARYGVATPSSYPADAYFSDVPSSHPYFPWIQKMKQLGITSGCSATTYCPSDPVTRGQMAVFIMRGEFNQLLPSAAPAVVWISTASAAPGQTATVTIAGQNTNFAAGVTQVNMGAGITVSNVAVTSATSLTAQLSVAPLATLGPRTVLVTTGPEEAVLPNGFVVRQ